MDDKTFARERLERELRLAEQHVRRAVDLLAALNAEMEAIESRPPAQPTAPVAWLSKREVARHLGVSTRWVEMRQADAGLPFRRVAGVNFYRGEEIDAWVRTRSTPPSDDDPQTGDSVGGVGPASE